MLIKKKIHKYCSDPCGKVIETECLKPVNSWSSIYTIPLQTNNVDNLLPGIPLTVYDSENPTVTWFDFDQYIGGCTEKYTGSTPGIRFLSQGIYRIYFNGTFVTTVDERHQPTIGIVFLKYDAEKGTFETKRNYNYNNLYMNLPTLSCRNFNVSVDFDMNQDDILYIGAYFIQLNVDTQSTVKLVSCNSTYIPFSWFQNDGFDPESGLNNEMVLQPILQVEKLANGPCFSDADQDSLCGLDTSIFNYQMLNNLILLPLQIFTSDPLAPIWIQFEDNNNSCIETATVEYNDTFFTQFTVTDSAVYNIEFYATIAYVDRTFIINASRTNLILSINGTNHFISPATFYQPSADGGVTNPTCLFTLCFKKSLYLTVNDQFYIGASGNKYTSNGTASMYLLNGLYDSVSIDGLVDRNIIFEGELIENCNYTSSLFIIKENNLVNNCNDIEQNKNADYTSFIPQKLISTPQRIPINYYNLSDPIITPSFINMLDKCYPTTSVISNKVTIQQDGTYMIKFNMVIDQNVYYRYSSVLFAGIIINRESIISLYSQIMYDIDDNTVSNHVIELSKVQDLSKDDIVEVFVFEIRDLLPSSLSTYIYNGETGIFTIPPFGTSNNTYVTINEPLLNVYKIQTNCERDVEIEQQCFETVIDCSFIDKRLIDVHFNDECTVDLFLDNVFSNKQNKESIINRIVS